MSDAYDRDKCLRYRRQLEEGLRCIQSLSQTRHLTAVMGVLLQTTHHRMMNVTPPSPALADAYEEAHLIRQLVNEMYKIASDSSDAEDAYLREWHRFLHLARTVVCEMESVIHGEDVEEIENI
jgi:hypothetical protein